MYKCAFLFLFTTICLHLFCSTFVQPIFLFIYKNSSYYSFLFIHLFSVSKNKTFMYIFCSLLFFLFLLWFLFTPLHFGFQKSFNQFSVHIKNSSSYVFRSHTCIICPVHPYYFYNYFPLNIGHTWFMFALLCVAFEKSFNQISVHI